MRGSMFQESVVGKALPPLALNGLSVDGPGTGPGFADDGKLSPEEKAAFGDALKGILDGVGGVLAPKPAPKPAPKTNPLLLLAGAAVVVGLIVLMKRRG